MKIKKVTYNPLGFERVNNITPKTDLPKNDLNENNIIIINIGDHYLKIQKTEESSDQKGLDKNDK